MQKNIKLPKSYLLIIAALIVVFTGALLYWQNRYVPGKITFKEFEPTYLPGDLKLQKKSIDAWHIPSGDPVRYTRLNLAISKGNYIYEEENLHDFSYSCGNGKVENQSCEIRTTPKGQQYVIKTTAFSSYTEQSIEWLKEGTDIYINFQSEDGAFSDEDIDKTIDSFRPVSYQNLPIHYYDKSSI